MLKWFGKKKKAKNDTGQVNPAQENAAAKTYDYSGMASLVRILTNGDEQVVQDMVLLAQDHKAFMVQYAAWCDEMLEGVTDPHTIILVAMAYWLTGYAVEDFTPPCCYGGYIDWKEATDDILWNLEKPIQNLGYPLSLSDILFAGDEFTDEALQTIGSYCKANGYTLVTLDTDSDCYHLFIVKAADFDRLVALGKPASMRFYDHCT